MINYRGKLESKIGPAAEKVYPTKNLYELFDTFPKGFTIRVSDSYKQDGVFMYRRIELYGKPKNKRIEGYVSLRNEGKEVERVNLVYSPNGKLSAENSNYSDELLPYKEFLFQKLTLNKKVFSKLKVISKSYNWETGEGEIEYGIKNKDINKFLHLGKDEEVTMAVKADSDLLSDNDVLSDGDYFLPIRFYQNLLKSWHSEGIIGSLEEENND
ncbi:MAG: hypothetical protein E7B43_03140 [Streptococcus sp.]|uniref:hypothetical protein n=1 Tax=Streptococcus sp. TaxID=1306 RepID=UPI0029051254|nr:hypothetical protein [Streptococcus sp.]MDU3069551.1 hypothetical protein [Streptococcus sp.]MDU5556433.1 hypothetical protein [Streptococcus sp.]